MSVVTSMNQLQMSSFSADVARVVPGSTITVTCKLKNTSGETIKSMSVGIGLLEKAFPDYTANAYVFTYAMGSRMQTESVGSWAAGKSKTFTWTVTLPDSELTALFDKYSTRAMPLVLYFVTANSADERGNDTYVCDVVGNSVTVLNSFCTPTVEKFEVVRTPDDESSAVAVSIKLAQSANAYSNLAWQPTCTLLYKPEKQSVFSPIDLTDMIPALLEGVTGNTDIVTVEISPQYDCDFKIVFEDAYESASRSTDVPNAFANFALSETGAGASFGMFPTSTEDKPKLESAYPIIPYAGIAGVNVYMPGVILHDFNEVAGTWIENGTTSPIHRVTVTFGAMAKDAEQQIDIGIPGSKVERIVSVDGMFDAGDGAWMSLMYSNDAGVGYHVRTAVINVGTAGSNLKLRLITGVSRTIERGHATIAYIPVKGE